MKPVKNKRKPLILVTVLLLIGLAAVAAWYLLIYEKNTQTESQSLSAASTQGDQKTEDSQSDQTSNTPADSNLQSDPASSTPAPAPQIPGSVTITSTSGNSSGVTVGTLVSGVTSGTCTATFQKGGQTVTDTAPLGLQVSYYLCKGFNPIARNKFPQAGEWTVQVTVKNNQGELKSETKKVTIP
jgi:cytoskeletal protein RodZ